MTQPGVLLSLKYFIFCTNRLLYQNQIGHIASSSRVSKVSEDETDIFICLWLFLSLMKPKFAGAPDIKK